jgi:hypothetical protein
MGALTFSFTKTEELKILTHTWDSQTAPAHCYLKIRNTAAGPLTLSGAQVNNVAPTSNNATGVLTAGSEATVDIGYSYTTGNKYDFTILTASGNKYTYTANAPS